MSPPRSFCPLGWTFPLSILVFLTSCGPTTKRELAEESGLRTRIDRFVEETSELARTFSFELDPIDPPAPLDPPPSRDNSLILSLRELGSVASAAPLTTDDYLGLGTAHGLGDLLQSSYRLEPVEEGWTDRIEEILGTRYLFVYWTPSYVPAKIVSEKTYEGGSATVSVSLYDRETRNWLSRFQVASQAKDRVEATALEHKLDQSLVHGINDLLRKGLLAQIHAKVEASCGGNLSPVVAAERE